MNDTKIVQNMIAFIEEKERKLQAEKMLGDNTARNDIVKTILDELDKEVLNENQ